jgi:hypothetical protein
MRGRVLLAMLLTAMALSACSKRDSLFIEPGKADAKPAKHEARKAAPAPPAPARP